MSNKFSVTVFGAANVDITGFSNDRLIYQDANIGAMQITTGGVGRNIAENLHHLGFNVKLISVFGDDPLSSFLIQDCQNKQLDIQDSLFKQKAMASTFLAIMDEQNDLALGLSAMDLYDRLSAQEFINILPGKLSSFYSVLDTNFSSEILSEIVQKYPGQKYILDTVSGKKALRSIQVMKDLYILKTNLLEAEMISGLSEKDYTDKTALVKYFLDQGVQKVFITLGKDGVVYGDTSIISKQASIPAKVVNTIGAGDAFVSGLLYADRLGADIHQMARYGMATAALTVSVPQAVNPQLNSKLLENKIYE